MRTTALQNTPHEAMQSLARFVKTVRLNQEMILEELSARSGVSRSSLIRLEKHGAGSIETQVKVFAALGVLDVLVAAFVPSEKQLTIDDLKKMSTGHQRQRGRRRPRGIS
jgi:transcriptional regulator with XRE-family HTH domain